MRGLAALSASSRLTTPWVGFTHRGTVSAVLGPTFNRALLMTWTNAFGFVLVGLAMLWLPVLAPGLVAPDSLTAIASTRESWLMFMGMLNTSLGSAVLGWHAMKHTWRVPAWLVRTAPQTEPLALPQATRAGVV